MAKRRKSTEIVPRHEPDYGGLLTGISDLLDQARRMTARTVNNILTATYWEIGRRLVEYEQGGKARAEYGEALLNGWERTEREVRLWFVLAQSLPTACLLPCLGHIADGVGKIRGMGRTEWQAPADYGETLMDSSRRT